LLRDKDVSRSFTLLVDKLLLIEVKKELHDNDWLMCFSSLMNLEEYDDKQGVSLLNSAQNKLTSNFEQQLLLNSVVIDLTSEISQLN